jgi:hypothetical protein
MTSRVTTLFAVDPKFRPEGLGLTSWRQEARKFSLIKLNPETGTDCKQATSRAAVETERENILRDDATVRTHANAKHESLAEMTRSLPLAA